MAKSTTTTRNPASSSTKTTAPSESDSRANKPIHTIRYKNLRASVWENNGANGPFHSVTFSRSYRDKDEQWHDVTSFNAGDLPLLAKLANDTHSWLEWHVRRQREEARQAENASDR
ncbi:MAG: hypothetical protein KatS3mg104_1798 [Phycisphaerae bacterium]|jgi:hypothetical protein|nr:MAG: hypothetical protein KatS3mg104_1798 [Phycisphaerae bacterium]